MSASISAPPHDRLEQLAAELSADEADAFLITALLLQDIAELESARKGKGRHGAPVSDEDLAFALFQSEANGIVSVIQDGLVARSIDNAVETDRDLLRELHLLEVQAAQDRAYAEALERGQSIPEPVEVKDDLFGPSHQTVAVASSDVQERTIPTLAERVDTMAVSDEHLQGVMGVAIRRGESSRNPVECTICTDRIRGVVINLPCGHPYDLKCSKDLFEACTRDEGLFPPRCCHQEIPLELIEAHLSSSFITLFKEKALEFTTVDRLYCSNSSCSRFLGSATKDVTAIVCPDCNGETCGACKSASHASHIPCSTDEASQQVLALARDAGWQQCPSCHSLVELSVSCYHMTCLCRHQFCYICAEQWKNCTCPQWDEDRLMHDAQQRVEREQQYENRVVPPAQMHHAVAQAAEELRVNHACAHNRWRYRHGGGDCENCGNYLPNFLMRCTGCQMLACKRCQRNRL